ncbi:hypothetical protein BC2230_100186 [Burkholderia cepacia]
MPHSSSGIGQDIAHTASRWRAHFELGYMNARNPGMCHACTPRADDRASRASRGAGVVTIPI